MSAKLGYCPSLVWRSILEGRALLEEGIRWKIGSGNQVRVWKDPWLPMPSTFRPVLQNLFLAETMTVADLILPHPRRWNKNLIEFLFPSRDVELIM